MHTRTGRPSQCGSCGECARCKRAAYMRAWYRRHSIEQRRAMRAGRDKERERLADAARYHEQRKLDPEWVKKSRARSTVQNAIRDGRLARGNCEVCGASDAQAHHDDYDRPLDVRWLCSVHHAVEHSF